MNMTISKPLIQINDDIREMNDDEFEQYKADRAKEAEKVAEIEAKALAKAALLERLGITADEAALLVQ